MRYKKFLIEKIETSHGKCHWKLWGKPYGWFQYFEPIVFDTYILGGLPVDDYEFPTEADALCKLRSLSGYPRTLDRTEYDHRGRKLLESW